MIAKAFKMSGVGTGVNLTEKYAKSVETEENIERNLGLVVSP